MLRVAVTEVREDNVVDLGIGDKGGGLAGSIGRLGGNAFFLGRITFRGTIVVGFAFGGINRCAVFESRATDDTLFCVLIL